MLVINHLREVRQSKGLTQKEVADVAIRLSKFLEVSMEMLYDV